MMQETYRNELIKVGDTVKRDSWHAAVSSVAGIVHDQVPLTFA